MPSETSSRFIQWMWALALVVMILIAVALVAPAIQQAREAARRSQSRNNLRQIGLALDNYHETYKRLPSGGVFDEKGTPFRSWTTELDLYLSQRSTIDVPDPRYPWDDPINIDLNLHDFPYPWQNHGVVETRSPDGFPLAHYAANQNLFYRNSAVSLDEFRDKGATMLLGDANGNYPPLGYPFNWRDLSLGLGTSPNGFGCPGRDVTMLLMADQSVRTLNNQIDASVAKSLAEVVAKKPTAEQVAKPASPYRLQIQEYWRYLNFVRAHKGLASFRLAPDRKYLQVDFRRYDDPEDAAPERWNAYFQDFVKDAPIEHVELHGNMRADELRPFLALPTLKRFSIREAMIADDKDAVLAARKDIVVD